MLRIIRKEAGLGMKRENVVGAFLIFHLGVESSPSMQMTFFQSLEVRLERGGSHGIGSHEACILTVIRIVTPAYAYLLEGILLVKGLSLFVGNTHLQSDYICLELRCHIDD